MKPPSVTFLTVKADLLASIVVFLVALPLCMGIAVAAGAKTRLSAILHGVWLLLLVSALPFLLRMIPTASLAAVLVFTGHKLINRAALRELREYGKSEVVIYLVTLATCGWCISSRTHFPLSRTPVIDCSPSATMDKLSWAEQHS